MEAKQKKQFNIAIIGIGLIGGSMAIDLRKSGFAKHIIGVDNDATHVAAALKMGLIDESLELEKCIAPSDIIIVAVPVNAAIKLIPGILDKVDKQIVTDVCSTKECLTNALQFHKKRKNYVAAHPMSGTEYSGPWAAMSGLFDGRAGIICDSEDSSPKAVEIVKEMYDCMNMRIIQMPAQYHDIHTAYVSHLSHVISFALALTVLDKEKDEKHIFDLASGGFSSTARLAKSSPEMWVPIFTQNKNNVLQGLETYINYLEQFRECIAESDTEKMEELIKGANRIKRIIR